MLEPILWERTRSQYDCFFRFFQSHLLSSPFFSLSLLLVTQIRGHLTCFSPSPLRFVPWIFIARKFQLFLPSSTRVELCLPTLLIGALSSWSYFFCFANKFENGYGKSSCWPWQHPGESPTYILHKDKTEHARTIFCVKLSMNNRIVGLVHENHIIRTRLMYHAACKVEFQQFKLSINNHIVGSVHKNHIIRTHLTYHAACKFEFQPFKRLYSADVFQLIILIKFFQKRWISLHRWPAVFWSSFLFSEQPRYCSVVDSKWDISGPTRNKRRAPPTRWT